MLIGVCCTRAGPIIDKLPIEFETVTVRGDLFDDSEPGIIYRQPPSPEVDAAWEAISDIQYFALDADGLRKMGKDPALGVKFPEDWGVGKDMYMAELDGQHQLHCLDQLRRYTYWDYYYGDKYTNL